jgi:hypothetical protein
MIALTLKIFAQPGGDKPRLRSMMKGDATLEAQPPRSAK